MPQQGVFVADHTVLGDGSDKGKHGNRFFGQNDMGALIAGQGS